MAEGQRAAEETKSVFQQLGDASEGLRKNVNSYADNLIGGTKTHGSTGIHPDVKKTGDELGKGVETAGRKVEQIVDQNKRR
ncbi:hypothetical protein LTR37_000429 [Vermiconidia calcicola]|uniref:Uncharacterized protein n=1 Tax=Vermiconidia calcicola TaxID=1690605 RepID=A0ACC3NY99_9PEZI|nr:hypothetical protein LTR37_000429 [Vermiconidia calcicola]